MQNQQFLYKSPNHATNLNEMRLNNKWCDVTIKVNQGEIRAHKVILAANLKYFDAMFSNDSFQESKDGIITMQSVDEADLEALVSYAYTGEILLTNYNALNLLECSNYLSEDGIEKACISFLEQHLKSKEACRIYMLPKSIECQSLKNAAKEKMLANFEECSKSSDFLDFDHGILGSILSDKKAKASESQKVFFEGIMRWIMQDPEARKIYMEELLNFIDLTKLTYADLMDYFYKRSDPSDKYGILKDTMFYYKTKIEEKSKLGQSFIVLNKHQIYLTYQFYNFVEKKWSNPQTIDCAIGYPASNIAIFNDQLFYVTPSSHGNRLEKFNPMINQSMVLSTDNISRDCAICACSNFLYLCGGEAARGVVSNQVLKYDPRSNSFETLPPMRNRRKEAASIFYQGCLYVLGGYDESFRILASVEKFDPALKRWTAVASMCENRAESASAAAVLNGKLYICGGFSDGEAETETVEVYDPATNQWQLVASMNEWRSGISVVAHEGKLFAFGGQDKTIEVYDPSKNQWQIDSELSSGFKLDCPTVGLISTYCIADEKLRPDFSEP